VFFRLEKRYRIIPKTTFSTIDANVANWIIAIGGLQYRNATSILRTKNSIALPPITNPQANIPVRNHGSQFDMNLNAIKTSTIATKTEDTAISASNITISMI